MFLSLVCSVVHRAFSTFVNTKLVWKKGWLFSYIILANACCLIDPLYTTESSLYKSDHK